MRFLRIITLMCLLAGTFVLSGCSGSTNYTAPPENFSLEDAGKMNLKLVDVDKLEKTRVHDVSGVSLDKYGQGYDIKYRYLNSCINVTIVKFYSPTRGDKFWDKWVSNGRYKDITSNGASVVSIQTKLYSIRAWQKDSWFTYIAVPTDIPNNKQLVEDIRKYINYQYQKL